MSKNRIQFGDGREVVVSKKSHKSKKEAQDNKLAERRKDDLHRAGKFYMRWKKAFCSVECAPQAMAGRMLALRDEISRQIRGRRIRVLCVDMIDAAIRRAHAIFGDHNNPINSPPPPEMPEK